MLWYRSGVIARALLSLFCLAGSLLALRADDLSLREEGVLYLDGNLPAPVMVTVKAFTTVYVGHDFSSALGTFAPGQAVQVIGTGGDGYILKGTYRNNTITGWIHPADLPPGVDPALINLARENQRRHDAVAVAIANKSVIQGMSPDEVQQSLGHPDQTSSRNDDRGARESWTFTTYERRPQYSYALDAFGHPYQQVYYVKVAVGTLTVEFTNGLVSAVEQHKTNDPNSNGVVTN